jgi:hypothetical protein
VAKGGIFEPIFEAAFEFTTRIFFPRVGSSSILDELSWSWLAALVLVGLAHISIKALVSAIDAELNEELAKNFKNRLTVCRWALWGALFLSLFMFRFATSF